MKGIYSLIIAAPLLFAGISSAADKEITEAEIQKMESAIPVLFVGLVDAKVWDEKRRVREAFPANVTAGIAEGILDERIYDAFKRYEPKARIKIARFDTTTRKFNHDDTYTVSGAEYRHALICLDAYRNYEKLDENARKRINREVFGQESKPKEVEKQNAGVARVKQFGLIIIGEAYGRANNGRPAPKSDVSVPSQEDALLWRAATTSFYYHNRVLVLPPDMSQNDPLVKKYLPNRDSWRTDRRVRLALEIRNKDTANEILRALVAVEQDIQSEFLPAAYEWARSDPFLLRLRPGEADARYKNIKRPILPSIDDLRKAKVSVSYWSITHHDCNTLIADTVGRHYFKALADKKVGILQEFHVREQDHGTAKIAYAGSKPLTNVVVVARATMRPAGPKAEATQRWVNFFNESFGPDADANKDAAQLLKATHVLHETEQANLIYFPVLEPGDDLVVDMYEHGFYWDVMEAKVSIYCDSGMLLDEVLFVGGPHNDLSLSAQERKRLTKPPPKEKPLGPVFTPLWRSEIVLKSDATGPFERCVPVEATAVAVGPVNTTYLPVGVKDQIDASKPVEVIARSADAYVAVGPKKQTGRALLLVPRSAVAKLNDLSKRKYEERKVEPLKKRTWLVLKPPAEGSTDYQLATAISVRENVCRLSGSTAGLAVRADEPFRAIAVGENEYVVVLPKPVSGSDMIMVLVPKSIVKEVKDKP